MSSHSEREFLRELHGPPTAMRPLSERETFDRLHTRVMRLADIGNIKVTVQCEKRLRDQLKEIVFMVHDSTSNARLTRAMQGLSSAVTKAWFNPEHPGEELEQIQVTRIMHWSEFTFGKENLAVVAEANMVTSLPQGKVTTKKHKKITVKIRKVTREYHSLTEDEGQNAVNTARNDKIKSLFPTLYCVGSIKCGFNSSWEFIGMELLEPVRPPGVSKTHQDFKNAMILLTRLHAQHYVHGDPHMGNFMRVPEGTPHPDLDEGRMVMIDQDSIRRLPDDMSLDNVVKYRITEDFNVLLMWNNRFVPFYHQFSQSELSIKAYQIYLKAPKPFLFTPPMFCGFTRDESDYKVSTILEKKQFAAFKKLLEETTIDEIYEFYALIFVSPMGFIRVGEILNKIHSKVSKFDVKGILT